MKSLINITIAVAGSILGVFIINIMLFCFVPSYHDALEKAVGKDEHIPVVTVNSTDGSVVIQNGASDVQIPETVSIVDDEASLVPLTAGISYGDSSFTEEEVSEKEEKDLQIIDKEYHEDCGTGKGYWVITYSDGSTSVE